MIALAFVLYDRSLKGHGVASGALLGRDICICVHSRLPGQGNCKYLCNGNNAYSSLFLISTVVTTRVISQWNEEEECTHPH